MIVEPKVVQHYFDPESILVIPSDDDALWIECEAIHPPSALGKRVIVRVPPESIVSLLKEARRVAAAHRKTTLAESEDRVESVGRLAEPPKTTVDILSELTDLLRVEGEQ